jgi:lysophospholipase L1-like esterase
MRRSRIRPLSSATRGRRGPAVVVTLLVVILLAALAVVGAGPFGAAEPSPTFSSAQPADASPTISTDATKSGAAASGSPVTPVPTPSPTAAPTAPALPSLLGAIGDSYSQAWSVSPDYLFDHPQFSWVVGTDKSDGVTSLLERFRALGGSPAVVDAATSGKKINDALRQANLVVAAAKKLAAGQTAYVTFELGTNDICASPDFMTDPAAFAAQLQSAVGALRAGLPAGSRILILPVPDFPHFREITLADDAARQLLALPANLNRCAPYLGTSSASALIKANDYLSQYDADLKAACDDIDANEAATGRLYCTYNAALLADSDFTIDDLSTVDYFHPSLSGQAKMAEDAWRAGIWRSA